MWRRISMILIAELVILGQIGPVTSRLAYAADTYSTFQQNDWRGGASTDNAADPTNQTGWTKYKQKGTNLDTSSADGVKMTTTSYSLTDDTHTDFNKGVFTNTMVTGTDAAATIGLNAVYQDPFCGALGEWANLPFTPSMGRVAPLARAGNYIYSLWVSWGDNKAFMRWSIADEKWEVMAEIPTSVGLGACLAYDGSDIIYALVGGNRKEFYAYKISTNTWYAKHKNPPEPLGTGAIPTAVGHGGAIVVIPSISKIFAFCGNNSSVFYRYNIPVSIDLAGSWSQAEAVQVNVGIGASLVYPGTGDYIYATTANGGNSFFRFDITASSAAWSSLPNVPFNLSWDSDICFPGAGGYIYAWNAGSRYFAKYSMSGNTWESSYYAASPIKNVELPALPYAFNSRAYLYDPDGSQAELRFLSAHSYSSAYKYYPSTKKWREESYVRAGPDKCRGATIIYVPDDGTHGPCLYYTAGNGKVMYRYYINFYAAASNLNISYQWEQLPDMVFSGNTGGTNCPGSARIVYMPGTNYIYAFQGNNYDCFSRFNILTNTWETRAAIPTKIRRGGTMATDGTYIYVLSGRNENDTALNKLYRYEPGANTWATMLDCPYGTFNCGASIAYPGGDYLYILRCASRSTFMRYRISTNTWETRANIPNVTWLNSHARNAELLYPGSGNSIYMVNSGCCWYEPSMAVYSISGDSWADKDDGGGLMHVSRVAGIGPSYIYSINDYQGLQMYSLSTSQWVNPHVGAQFTPGRFTFGSVVYKDDNAYLFNNYDSGYAWKYSVANKKWTELIKLPFLAAGPGLRATYPGTGDWIYVLQGNRSNKIWKYNTSTKAWVKLANSPYNITYGARMVSGVVSSEARIYVCPGNYYSNIFLQFVDDDTGEGGGSWMTLTNMLESISNEGNGTCIIPSGTNKGIYMLRTAGTVKFTKYNIDDTTWSYKADAPWAISDYACLVYPGTGDFLYALKGSGRDFAKYSLSLNSWTILTDASISVSGNPGGFYPGSGDLIYFYLGTNHGLLGANFNRYSISQNKWDEPIQFPASNSTGSQICPMPSGEEIFYMRGASTEFYKYNITNSVWYTLNLPPSSVTYDAKAVYPGTGDYIYVTRGDGYYDIWKYSVSTDLWTNLAVPPATLSTGQAMAYRDNYLYIMRGGSTVTFWRYSIADNNWKQYGDTPTTVSRGASLINPGTDKFLYATAGGGATAFWRYNADLNDSTNDEDGIYNTWQSLSPLPMPSSGGVLFSPGFGDYIYYFVSYNYDISYGTNHFYRYCISTNTWDTRPNLPFVFNGQSSATYPGTGDYIYLASGYGTSSLMKYLLFSSGIFISDIKEIGNNAGFGNVSWVDNSLGQVDLKVRTGQNPDLSDALDWSYVVKAGKNTDLSNYSGVSDKDQYLQYRLRFFCYDLSQVPQFDNITLNWTEYPLSQELVSSAYNTTYATNRLKNISWSSTLPTGTDVRFQVHTAPDSNGQPGTWGPWYGPAGVQQFSYEFSGTGEYANTSEVVVSNGTAKLSKILQDYLYRQQIIVDNTSGSQLYTDCTVKIEVPATNIDFWNHISSNGSDIRFVDSDGKTPLKYRVLGFNKNKKSATCWVTVPTIPLGATKSIYILYGKSTASSESDSTLAESLIGTDFYGFMFAFFDIVTTDAPNRVTIDKLDASGQVIASAYRDFTAVGEKQRYDDSDLTVYHITSQKPITIFSSSIEPSSSSDDDWYVVCGNDLWLWCPANNYDGDVIITAYNDDTQVKITDHGLGDDNQTIGMDKGNFWFGWNRVDSRGEVWHIEATKPITVMAGLINHGEASEQIRSPDMKEYYFYCPDSYLTLTAYEDATNIIIDNLDSVTGDYSGTLNKGQSYKHIPNPPTGTLSMRTYIWADKPICVVADDMSGGKGQIYQSADTLVGVGKEYYMNTAGTRYLRLVAFEDGGTSVTVTGDVSPSPSYVSLGSKGSSVAVDPGATWRNLQLVGDKKFGLYTYNSWSEAITPVFKVSEFNYRMPTYMVTAESAATSTNPALSGWQYKETLNVDNTTNDVALTNFQVYVDIDKNHKDFWQHVNSNGSDVRFVDSDDTTILSYYLDNFSASEQTARFWIKLPALSNTVKKSVYMYYGNASATSQSSGDNVFEFFDGFDSGLDKWNSQYCNLMTISSIFGMDSSAFIVDTGTTTPSTNVVIPSGVVTGRNYDWYWELRWPNSALVDSQTVAQPYTLRYGLASMTDGPFMIKNIDMPAAVNISSATWSNNVATITTSAAHNLVFPAAVNISSATWSNNVATITTSAGHGLTAGKRVNISGVSISAYNGTYTVASVVDATSFTVALPLGSDPGAGSSGTSQQEAAAPKVVIAGVTPTAYNGTYTVASVINSTSFTVSLVGSNPGAGSGGTIQAGQAISALGGTFTNNETTDLLYLKFRFTLTDVNTGTVFSNIDSTTFDLVASSTATINNLSIVMPPGLAKGHLYYWSWVVLNVNNNTVFDSSSAPSPLYNIAVGFKIDSGPVLPTAPIVGGTTRSASATFSNTSGLTLNNLIWRFTLTDTSQGGRSTVKVAHNGYLQSKTNMSPNYNITSQVVWQAANKTGRHFVGISDPNAKYATDQGNASYLAGYDVLMNTNGYFYDESGDGYTSWESIRMAYTATMWNTEKMTWTPHNPGATPPKTGKVIYELSSGDKLTYNAGFVAGPNLSIKPTVRSSLDAIFIDKFMVYKSATVSPYVGFIYSETANPTGMEVYYKTNPTIQPILGVFYDNNLVDFAQVVTIPSNTNIKYQVSCDGYNWYWHNGTSWAKVSGGFSQANTATEIKNNLTTYLTGFPSGEFWYRAYLNSSDGINTPELDKITITTTTEPTYYITPEGSLINSLNRDTVDDQWFQYKAILSSVGQETPVLTNTNVEYIKSFIQVTAPNGSETLNSGQTTQITWNAQAIDGTTGKVKIQYSTDGGSTYPNTIVSNLANTGSYGWLIPDNPSQTAKIKISSEDFPLVYDESDAAFRILALEVTSPNGGEIWEAGKPHAVTWTASGTLSHDLTIKYSINSGETWTLVSANRPPSPAIYTWTVANSPSDTASLKIYDPLNENILDTSNNLFAIVPQPKITINSPVAGDVWKQGLVKNITWTANQNWFSPTVDIEYSRDDFNQDVQNVATGVSIGTPVGSNPNDDINGSYQWTVPNAFSDQVKVRVKESAVPADRNGKARDTQLAVKGLSGVFTITAPTITISSPSSSDILVAGETFRVVWLSEGYISNSLLLEYSKDGTNWVTISGSVSNENKYYDWAVPVEATGDTVMLKITDETNTQVNSTSSTFKVLGYPAIKVIAPNGSENLVIGEQFNIKWQTWGAKLLQGGNDYQAIKISFSSDNGVSWDEINSQQVNDGDYPWEIPDAESAQCLIKVEDENDPLIFDVCDAVFNITIPSIILTAPNGSESWFANGSYNITWTSRGYINPDSLLLEYSTDGATWHEIKKDQANTGSYTWKVQKTINSTTVRVRITDSKRTTITDTSDNNFTVKPPTITVLAPKGDEEWVAGLVYEVKWTSEGYDVGAINDDINIRYSIDGGTSWLDTNLPTGEANIGSYMWLVPSTVSNTCMVKIYDGSWTQTVGTSPSNFKIVLPYIRVLSPNGTENWPIGTLDKVITFRSVGDISNNLKIEYSKDNFTNDFHTVATGVSKGALQEDGSYLGSYAWITKVNITSAAWSNNVATITTSAAHGLVAGQRVDIAGVSISAYNGTYYVASVVSPTSFTVALPLAADPGTAENSGTSQTGIPNDFSTSVKVRVTDSDWLAIYDVSDNFFTVGYPIIKVTRPNGGDLFTVGDPENITWTNTGGISSKVNIEYSKNDFSTAGFPIANDAPNTIAGGTYSWTIPSDISASVKIRITDAGRSMSADKSDATFSILPTPVITIDKPNGGASPPDGTGELWRVGTSQDITWHDNGGVISNNLTLEYSNDVGATWKPIASGVPNSGGKYSWTIPDDVQGSRTYLVRITDANRPSTTDVSNDTFTIALPKITITSPAGGEFWALTDFAPVSWTCEGAVSSSVILEYSPDLGTTWYQQATVNNTGSYTWNLDPNNPSWHIITSSSALFRIKDLARQTTVFATSGIFQIDPLPTLTLTSPGLTVGETYILGDVMEINWTWTGLSITNVKFEIYDTSEQKYYAIAPGETIPNNGRYLWQIPETAHTGPSLQLRISEAGRLDRTINNSSRYAFVIRGGFTLSSPNGGENWVAKSPQTINWTTRGQISFVNLEYTIDGTNWNVIASSLTNSNSYSWILPDVKSSAVKVRVSNAGDSSVFDLSDNPFNIVYASVKFNVLDFDTYQHLSELSAEEPSTSWSTGFEMTSPVIRTAMYPYGTYTTFFKKNNFIDNSVTWTAPKQGTDPYVITMYMESTASAQVTWEAILTYSYAPADDSLSAVGSLQRKGKLVGTRAEERAKLGVGTFTIYETDGNTIRKQLITTVNDSGMFIFPAYANTVFEAGKVYPATISIVYNDTAYISTANIDVGSEKLQYEFFTKTAEKLATSVSSIEAAVAGGTAQTRADIEASRVKLVGDIAVTEATIKSHVTSVLSSTESTLKTQLTTTETGIKTKVEEARSLTETSMKSQILNAENLVKSGETLTIRYRTYSGLNPTIDVYNADNEQVVIKGKMVEINSTGVYEYDVPFAQAWGKGDFTVVCSESSKGVLDAMSISVIKTNIEAVYNQVSAVLGSTAGISGLKQVADSMNSQFSIIETALSKVGKDLLKDVKDASNSASALESVYNQLASVAKQVKNITGETGINLEKLYKVSSDKKQDMVYLKNKTQELKAAMALSTKMVDNIANKPITQTWYEYKK